MADGDAPRGPATVAVTGVGGLIGRRLVAELDGQDGVGRILGLDVRTPEGLASTKLDLRHADVREPDLADVLAGVDVVVHLAFQLDPIADEALMRAINIDGTRNVFEAAAAAGVRKVVYVSSGVVYGAHPDNDFPLTEDSPVRANPDFNYAEHKAEIEQWLAGWTPSHPELTVTILRPSIVAGPGVQNFITRLMEQPRFTAVRGHRPPMQFAHVDDVASALAHAVVEDLPGAYNVTSEGWLSFDEVTAIGGAKVAWVPEELAFSMAERMWRMGLGESPPGFVHYVMHPWVLSVDKLTATGWRPKHSNRDALVELVEEHRDYVSLGRMRAERSKVRAVLAGVGALLAAIVWRARRSPEAR
ncbi:MAG: NAD-dependent epimerase/dehydratase family protein [Actinobacteria bacterium]|nr:NAD-dependent epimerase/dehydratase family protein [Actinomycetota bacterium]